MALVLAPLAPPWTPVPDRAKALPAIAEAADSGTALVAARRQGTNVTVTGMTDETRLVQAMPDGNLSAELTMRPVRAKRGDRWVPVDTTLVRRADGSVAPRSATVDVAFSGGGDRQPLVAVGVPTGAFALTWPGSLPAPRLSGSAATYPDVLPGVDLVLRAEPDGYVKQFVVKDAAAAKQQALAGISLGLRTEGIAVQVNSDGTTEMRDRGGRVVLTGPPSTMWDRADPVTHAAGEGSRQARVGVRVERDTVTLVPDQALLRDPATRFPVVVDPSAHTPYRHAWAKVFSGYPNDTYWNGGQDGNLGKVGQCPRDFPDSDCRGIAAARTYYMFDTSFLVNRNVIKADFLITATNGTMCDDRSQTLFLVHSDINGAMTWNNQPGSTALSHAPVSGCGNRGAGWPTNGNINHGGMTSYMLGGDEGTSYESQKAWRRYDSNSARVYIEFNATPNMADAVAIYPPLPAPCRWCANVPFVSNRVVQLKAQHSDADNDQLRADWAITDGRGRREIFSENWLNSGSWHEYSLDLADFHDQTVSWAARATDPAGAGAEWRAGPGPFRVDRVGVTVAPGVSGVTYPQDNRWHGGVDVPGSFTFTANGVADIDHYIFSWTDPPDDTPTTSVAADRLGGNATVTLLPPGDGPRTLYVQSVDRAGHRSPVTYHRFYVRAGSGPLAQWSFEGNTTDTAFLGWRNGTLEGSASYTDGAVGTGLALDGVSGMMTAPGEVPAAGSYSVSAWVYLDRLDKPTATVVSQSGNEICAFCLQYQNTTAFQGWVFTAPQSDSATPAGYDFVRSSRPPTERVWTQLTATYDAGLRRMQLFVDGELAGSKVRPGAWSTTNPLRIGHHRMKNAQGVAQNSEFFPGRIDELKLYDRALSESEVRASITRDNVQVGQWSFDDPSTSRTASNSVPGGQAMVLNGNARIDAAGEVKSALKLSGADDYAVTSDRVVRTDRSFTIAAWLRIEQAPAAGAAATAVSQDASVNSGFMLNFRNVDGGQWELVMPARNVAGAPEPASVVRSGGSTAAVNTSAHVAIVYDAPTKKIRIYVDGWLKGETVRTDGFDAVGPLIVGRGRLEGAVVNPWPGKVDELRAYSRAVTQEELQGIVGRDGGAAGQWAFDGNLQATPPGAKHGTAGGSAVEYTGGQSVDPSATDLALRLNGTSNYVTTDRVVNPGRNFSVAAWVRLDKVGGTPAVVSQDRSNVSGFQLHATSDGKWAFAVGGDEATGAVSRVTGPAVQIGQWTHLVGVYDAAGRQAHLYVNGVIAGTVGNVTGYDKDAARFVIGAAQRSGQRVDYFPGAIDDVAAYVRPLFADEIKVMAGRDVNLVHHWKMDEPSGRNLSDAVGTTRTATLAGGTTFTAGRVGNGVQFDGRDGQAATTGIDVRTDRAFTIATWVKLPSTRTGKTVAVSVDGTSGSKFRLGHLIDNDMYPNGAWYFEMPESDAADAVVTRAAVATEEPDLDGWVHLTGVYDPAAKMLWLYVNGMRYDEGVLNNPWPSSGGVAIGRGKLAGQPAQFWNSAIDDVRLYTGAFDKNRIKALYDSYPAEIGSPSLPTANVGRWTFNENTGTTAADTSGRGLTATMAGGAEWTGGRSGPAGWFNGTSSYAETAGPVIDTTQSFSAAAWVYLDREETTDRTILGQDGNQVSLVKLQYRAQWKKWAVVVAGGDENAKADSVVLLSTESAPVWEWTHLAIVYDATLRQVRLYVNGVLSAAQVGVVVPDAKGRFAIGRARYNGANTGFFPRGIDDVRVFGKPLSGGEVRRVHDDVGPAANVYYRFDDNNTNDSTWRKNHATVTGGVTYGPGVTGPALRLDGSGYAESPYRGVLMRDSFTVSAWAYPTRSDRVMTILSQDGDRNSGIVLQYRPGVNRWVFGQAASDADGAPMVYVASLKQPALERWTHVSGVYDYPARQLRLYVDGQLVGVRNDTVLWQATGKLALGRSRENGAVAGTFLGALDEIQADAGVVSDEGLAARAGWPAPVAGQLGAYVNMDGDRYTGSTGTAPRDGYRFSATFGLPAAAGPNTAMLYGCRDGGDGFVARDAACGGKTALGAIGLVYTVRPTNLPTVPLYTCATATDRFESLTAGCDGAGVTGTVLGFTVAYGLLARYRVPGYDHHTTVQGTPPGYLLDGPAHGYLDLTQSPGTVPLWSCREATDRFLSTDATCEGKTAVGVIGFISSAPVVGATSGPLYRCSQNGQRLTSMRSDCDGLTVDRQLGYIRLDPPTTTAEFSA
ncbi:LamG domain-containing protein [Virgisporangium aurantiacum]|uniref:LamG domain-containing protein n=1 Tax=Virgisporangium aurantiacum TaxID=175570 RepID=UPI0019527480|nr:LamG domain-containing protein [Virgisporangium aurantiacum]